MLEALLTLKKYEDTDLNKQKLNFFMGLLDFLVTLLLPDHAVLPPPPHTHTQMSGLLIYLLQVGPDFLSFHAPKLPVSLRYSLALSFRKFALTSIYARKPEKKPSFQLTSLTEPNLEHVSP